MAKKKLRTGYYTYKGSYLWMKVLLKPGENDLYPSGRVDMVDSPLPWGITTAVLKTKDKWGDPGWDSQYAGQSVDRQTMTGGEFNRRKWRWRKVKACNVPYVWRELLKRFKGRYKPAGSKRW